MKRRVFGALTALLMLAVLALPLTALAYEQAYDPVDPAEVCYMDTDTDLLTQEERETLDSRAYELSEQYQCGVYMVLVNDMAQYGYTDIEEFTMDYYEGCRLGFREDGAGIILCLSVADRDYALLAHGEYGHYAFTDYGTESMCDYFLGYFGSDDWYGGFAAYLDACYAVLEYAANGTPLDVPQEDYSGDGGYYYDDDGYYYDGEDVSRGSAGKNPTACVGVGVGVGLISALIACGKMKSRMKTAVEATAAGEYVAENGVDLQVREDRFTHMTQVRQVINNSSRSGGGSRGGTHINSRGFSGRSGKF